MPTYNNSKLPALPPAVANPLPRAKTTKRLRRDLQEPSTQPNVSDRTAKFINLGNNTKESR